MKAEEEHMKQELTENIIGTESRKKGRWFSPQVIL